MKKLSSILFIALVTFTGCEKKPTAKQMPTPRVEVAHPKIETVPKYVDAIGHMTAYNSVDIKSQVEGQLVKIHYTQGKEVKTGDLLVTIDPRPYEAALAKAEAQLAENLANLAFAKDKVTRYETLVTQNYVSQLDYDQFVTTKDAYEAQILKDQAMIDEATINLSYCYIRAPFSGQCGKQLIDEGNLITNNGQTLLTINQLDPIYVDFTVSERDLFSIKKWQAHGALQVHIHPPDQPKEQWIGHLIVINNEVDEKIGMVKLRGEVANPSSTLWPGQFVRVKLLLFEKPNTILVPISAVNSGQKGKYVYKVSHQNQAVYQAVELGQTYGDYIEVLKGVDSDDTLITRGQINLKPGSQVTIVKRKQQ